VNGYTQDKDAYLKRMRRIEGQVRGIAKMIEGDQYCIDVLTQVAAATKALEAVALGLLDEHLRHCVVQAAADGGGAADEKIAEASAAIARLVKS
jgi:DNA-binding FrmR family transcriptional regulator